jgi:dolichol kinase
VSALQEFVDERDSGVIYVTHFTLLLGLAVPIWLCMGLPGVEGFAGAHSSSGGGGTAMHCESSGNSSGNDGSCLAPTGDALFSSTGGSFSIGADSRSSASALLLVMAGLSGMVIIGVGDTAASMVGKLLGRVPIHKGSRKTVEGTVAGIVSSLGSWCLLLWAGGVGVPAGMSCSWWLQLVLATAGAGLMEAVTSQLDNVLLPLWYLPHLLLVQQ